MMMSMSAPLPGLPSIFRRDLLGLLRRHAAFGQRARKPPRPAAPRTWATPPGPSAERIWSVHAGLGRFSQRQERGTSEPVRRSPQTAWRPSSAGTREPDVAPRLPRRVLRPPVWRLEYLDKTLVEPSWLPHGEPAEMYPTMEEAIPRLIHWQESRPHLDWRIHDVDTDDVILAASFPEKLIKR